MHQYAHFMHIYQAIRKEASSPAGGSGRQGLFNPFDTPDMIQLRHLNTH